MLQRSGGRRDSLQRSAAHFAQCASLPAVDARRRRAEKEAADADVALGKECDALLVSAEAAWSSIEASIHKCGFVFSSGRVSSAISSSVVLAAHSPQACALVLCKHSAGVQVLGGGDAALRRRWRLCARVHCRAHGNAEPADRARGGGARARRCRRRAPAAARSGSNAHRPCRGAARSGAAPGGRRRA